MLRKEGTFARVEEVLTSARIYLSGEDGSAGNPAAAAA